MGLVDVSFSKCAHISKLAVTTFPFKSGRTVSYCSIGPSIGCIGYQETNTMLQETRKENPMTFEISLLCSWASETS